MTGSILFRTEAALFAANIVHTALSQLEKVQKSGGFEMEWNGFELDGTEKRGSSIGLIRLSFGRHPLVNATCRLICADGKWQAGTVEIKLVDTPKEDEKNKWKFCGRLTAEHALEVYELGE